MIQYVDKHGNEVLNLGSFTLLPQHVVRLILSRDELQADEFSKFQVKTDHTVHLLLACRASVTIQVGWTVLSYKI